jgi:uncharacterized protein (TIGR03067 family)
MARLLAVLGAFVFAGPVGADDKDAGKFEGTYTIVGGEHGGEKIPAERIEGAMVTITADKMTATDKDKKEFFAATYTLDRTAKPHRITMVSTTPKAGEKASGVVDVSGDTVKICYNLPGGTPPTEFKTQDKQHCFVLKRVKKGKE